MLGARAYLTRAVCLARMLTFPHTNLADDMLGSLKSVVFALPDDLSSLVLLEHIQEHLGDGRDKVRFVVLMKELRWAEAFSMLDAVPLHEFVSATQVTLFSLFACFLDWP